MKKKIWLLAAVFLAPQTALSGGALETVDITGLKQTFPPFFDGTLIPIKWDTRCMPVQYTFFNDGINEPPGATAAIQSSLESWNEIPTSFIEFELAKIVNLPGNPFGAYDFVNEINFDATGGFLAAAPSVALIADSDFMPGDDIDGDGDADVYDPAVEGINHCTDVDGDGDNEFPAGSYAAGTILDNDVFFNELTAIGLGWETTPTPTSSDPFVLSDVEAVAVHEWGHSHGLSHSMINQSVISSHDGDSDSDTDSDDGGEPGSGATMFPFIDINDANAELDQRTLHSDDIAWSSLTYPEGSTASGPGALQSGDVAFDDVYGVIEGEVFSGAQGGAPVAGASVQAVNEDGRIISEGYSGTTQVGVFIFFGFPADAGAGFFLVGGQDYHILNGNYRIPVPEDDYKLFIEALDGDPAAAGNISISAILGNIFGQLTFEEEFWNKKRESNLEDRPAQANEIEVDEGEVVSGVHFTTNVTNKLSASDGSFESVGFTGAPGGRQYAVRFAGADVLAFLGSGEALHTALFATDVVDSSVVVEFAEARLAGGSLDGGGNVVIQKTLRKEKAFTGQDTDSATMFFKGNPRVLAAQIVDDITSGEYDDLYLILELNDGPFPGVSATPPVVGLDLNTSGSSYISDDGGATFSPIIGLNFVFDLVATP